MELGIVGLPNVGKSSLFNALTKMGIPSENYPFCTIDRNIGNVPVPDVRLEFLKKIYKSNKLIPAFVDFVDIAGLVKGASNNEGLGNKFLSHIREVDAILHIVRCFVDPEVIHVDDSIDPVRDIETINTELIIADIESLQKRMEKNDRAIKLQNDRTAKQQLAIMERLLAHLSDGNPARTFDAHEDEKVFLAELFLLTNKPTIYVANIADNELGGNYDENEYVKAVKEIAQNEGAKVLVVSASFEEQISLLDEEEKNEYLEAMGLKESGLAELITASYDLLGLISFLTANESEARAWTIKKGTKAPQAAGKIHTDFEKGFIRAEVIAYDDLVKYGSISAARDAGKVRVEGKDYVVEENNIIHFRFNV